MSRPELARLLERTKAYYADGLFELEDLLRVSEVLVARDAVLLECAAAVLQALLLKLEENMVADPRAYEELMAAYARSLHAGVLQGSLSAQDLETWPLLQGLNRVDAQKRMLDEPRSASSAMVLNFCAARDRFGEVHELRWLLEPPFGDPARSAEFGGEEMGLLRHTDLYIYLVEAPKCRWLGDAVVEELKGAVRSVNLVPYKGGPEREEQTAYFKFLSDHYEDLPDFTIFVHPDAPEHQGSAFLALRRALKLMQTHSRLAHEALRYYPLAQQMVVEPRRTWGASWAAGWLEFWEQLFDRPWQAYGFRPPRCRWEEHPGTYIGGLVPGSAQGLSRPRAKAVCAAAAEACLGITCGTSAEAQRAAGIEEEGSGQCSARAGLGPGPLLQSPGGLETSFVKSCAAAESGSAHEDAVLDAAAERRAAAAAGGGGYAEHRGAYLADFAEGDSGERAAAEARARCEDLGERCGGYTCEAAGSPCTVRRSGVPVWSPVAETSFVKLPRPAEAAGGPGHTAPERGGERALFQLYTGSQSVVHRDRARLWSRAELAALAADGPFCSKFSGFYEAVWHAMFGEPLAQPPREGDARLPMFLKWGIPTLYSYGDEGVV